MAGGKFSEALLNAMTIRESATDGSDFTNPTADYRRLFLGEDGSLHLKDSAGTVTAVGGSSDIATATFWAAKGDLAAATGNDAASVLSAGNNKDILVYDSSQSTGLRKIPRAAQAVADPIAFDGSDTIDGSSTTPFVDVDAFTTKEVLNSRVLHLKTVGASQDDRVRVTLGTTRAGVFDIQTRVALFGLYWSAGTGDAYLEILGSTSGGSQIFIARVIPVNLNNSGTSPFGRVDKLRVGHTAITSIDANVEPVYPLGEPLTLRIQRDGSNILSFSYGLGHLPLALGPVITSSEAPYAPTSSGTLARIEYSIHTPSGPGGSAQWDAYVDYLLNV